MFQSTQQHEVVLRVKERLAEVSIGETVSYDDLASSADADIRGLSRWVVQRAREILTQENGIIFAPIQGVGLRRLGSADGTNHIGERSLLRIRRAARLGMKRLTRAVHHANDLSPTDQRLASRRLCSLGLIEHFSMSRTVAILPDDHQQPDPLEPLKAAFGIK